jgi:uncharacterized Zn finger protein (UPF0148 family)
MNPNTCPECGDTLLDCEGSLICPTCDVFEPSCLCCQTVGPVNRRGICYECEANKGTRRLNGRGRKWTMQRERRLRKYIRRVQKGLPLFPSPEQEEAPKGA